jgi:hypothetical protein
MPKIHRLCFSNRLGNALAVFKNQLQLMIKLKRCKALAIPLSGIAKALHQMFNRFV